MNKDFPSLCYNILANKWLAKISHRAEPRNKGRGRQCNQPTIIPKLCAMKTSVPEVLRDAPLKRGSMAILICEMLLIIYFWWVTLPTNLLKYRRIFFKKKWEKGSRGLKVVEGASRAQSQDRELQPKAVAHTRALRQECLTHSWGRGQCG